MIEYALANPIPFKDDVKCVVNDEKVYLTKEDLALSNTKIENCCITPCWYKDKIYRNHDRFQLIAILMQSLS